MKKLIITAAFVVGIAFLAKRFGPKIENIDWEKRFEALPDNAPPKWMFRNISEIRSNTERILGLLEASPAGAPAPEEPSRISTAD